MDEIKQFLVELKYPNITSMNNDDFTRIFLRENIQYFFQWYVKELLAEGDKYYTNNELVDILCNFGMCSSSEKRYLLTGELPFHTQVKIFHQMLANLKRIKQTKEMLPFKNVSLDEVIQIAHLAYLDIDLFPQLTGKKSYSDKESEAKVHECSNLIVTLEEEMRELELQLENNFIPETQLPDVEYVDITSALETLNINDEMKIQALKNVSRDEVQDGGFSNEFPMQLEECSKLSQEITQYYENIKTVEDFNVFNNSIKLKEPGESRSIIESCLKAAEEFSED